VLHKELPTDEVGQFLSMVKFEKRAKLDELPDALSLARAENVFKP
jgi:hypothetical protein